MSIKKLLSFSLIGYTLVSVIGCNSCSNDNNNSSDSTTAVHADTIRIYDYNIVIAPDLSNRINPKIHPKPVSDLELLHYAFEKDNLVKILELNNRQIGQNDIYKVDFINRGILNEGLINIDSLKINLTQFNIYERADYIREQLEGDITNFKKQLSKAYDFSLKRPAGSDIWNYLNEHCHESIVNTNETINHEKLDDNTIIRKETQNILVILTDGYIEHVNPMPGYSLSKSKVDRIRNEFKNSGQEDLKAFILSKPEFLLKKTDKSLEGVHLRVFEFIDRSLTKDGATQVQPTDFQIMKIIWEKWLFDCGAESVEIYASANSKTEFFNKLKSSLEKIN